MSYDVDMGTMFGADEKECECGRFTETGTCWHVKAFAAIVKARGGES